MMRTSRFLSLSALVASMVVCGAALATAAAAAPPATLPEAPELARLVLALQGSQAAGSCSGTLLPSRRLVVGALTERAIKPSEASARLDKLVAAARALAVREELRLELGEVLRMVGGDPEKEGKEGAGVTVMQRIEVELPASLPPAAVDRVLDQLLVLGLDRFGPDLRVLSGRARQPLVLAAFDDVETQLAGVVEGCREAARAALCRAERAVRAGSLDDCLATVGALASFLRWERHTLRARNVLLADGRESSVEWYGGGGEGVLRGPGVGGGRLLLVDSGAVTVDGELYVRFQVTTEDP